MNAYMKLAAVAAATLFGSGLAATSAAAGCGDETWLHPATLSVGGPAPVLEKAAVVAQDPIVGLWVVTFTDSSGKVADFGYQQWHSDGTEILNSGSRAPASENFCLGAWAEPTQNHYVLNHWALSYDPASGKLNARVNIHENVSIDANGGTFGGSYAQDVFDPTGAPLAHLTGTIRGSRIIAR